MNGAEQIIAERARQIQMEGYDSAHDDHHDKGDLADAAAAYAKVASAQTRGATIDEFPADMLICEGEWPWAENDWKPSVNPVKNLVKAGALIAAEIDRLMRLEGK